MKSKEVLLVDEQRKITIINEIRYWKDNHLLPEHYCDFLMALYTEGEQDKADALSNSADTEAVLAKKRNGKVEKRAKEKMVLPHLYALVMVSLIPMMLVVRFLTPFSPLLDLGVALTAFGLASLFYYISVKIPTLSANYTLTVYMMSILMISLVILDVYQQGLISLISAIIPQFILWIYLIIKKKDRWLLALTILIVLTAGISLLF